jgi:hypothetical protein
MNVRRNKTIRSKKIRRLLDRLSSDRRNQGCHQERTGRLSSAKGGCPATISSPVAIPADRLHDSKEGIGDAIGDKAFLFSQGVIAIR